MRTLIRLRKLASAAPGLLALPLLGLAACGTSTTPNNTVVVTDGASAGGDGSVAAGGDAASAADGAKADAAVPANQPVVDLVVDSNRDGVAKADDKEDQDFEEVFDTSHGASFLPNLDDDDSNKVEDFYDEAIPDDSAAKDLARIAVRPWKDAPEGTTVKLNIEPADMARVWLKFPDGSWGWLLGAQGACTSATDCAPVAETALPLDALRSGAELGLEGRQFRMSNAAGAWDGNVTITMIAYDKDGLPIKAPGTTDGTEKVVLRVAPWMLNGNLSDFDLWKSINWGTQSDAATFNADLNKADMDVDNAKYETYGMNVYSDQWTQDWYQTGIVQVPAEGGKVHGARVYNARPFSNGPKTLPIDVLRKQFLGPDRIIIAIYKKKNSGSSFDSHGNHDLLPPFENGSAKYPLGRIITGSGVLPETWDFYEAQRVQGPVVKVVTNWLAVGHCDEILSYVPAKTKNGWKLLAADDKLAIDMFTKLQKDGHGATELFVGKKPERKGNPMKVQPTVDSTLADTDLMQSSQKAHIKTEDAVVLLKGVLGFGDSDVVPIPFLTEDFGSGQGMIAWQPGTANDLVVYDHIMLPNPFGPIVDGKDVFAQDLLDRLGTAVNALGHDGNGLKVHLIDDYYGYHLLMGEVHCGTNPEGPPNPKLKWWTVSH